MSTVLRQEQRLGEAENRRLLPGQDVGTRVQAHGAKARAVLEVGVAALNALDQVVDASVQL